MMLALKELQRTPGRFLPVTFAMTLLVVLLVVLGGFLDGLELSQTGSYRALSDRLWAFSASSELQLGRSTVDAETRETLADLPGVERVGQLSQVATTAGLDDAGSVDLDDLEDIIFVGYDLGSDVLPEPPEAGIVVDEALVAFLDVEIGDSLVIGPQAESMVISAIVDDVSQGSPTVWTSTEQWRSVTAALPTAVPPPDVSQVVIIETDGSVPTAPDGVQIADLDTVIGALDVVQQQSSTFQGIIGVTFVVTLIVVALFFALITLERVLQYAVLKAVGASTRDLITTITVQALVVSVIALIAGGLLAVGFIAALPPDLPIRIVPSRLYVIALGTIATAILGSLFTLRRINGIDPAEAIG